MQKGYIKDDTKASPLMKQIENYEFRETLGKGTFGKVKKAVFIPTNETFAIKILNKKVIEEKKEMYLVIREFNIIKKFKHVNVIKVYEIIEDENNFYIIMEYCALGELFDYIVANKKLTEEETAFFFFQLINGVEHIHSQNVVHRDLKPENLLLTSEKRLKIIDFGLSSNYDGNFLSTKCGSPSYAAPELIKQKSYNGLLTDIWCCGIILFAMICGYLPFDGEENKILFKNILETEVEFPKDTPPQCREAISLMLEKDPSKRIEIEEIKKLPLYIKGKKKYIKAFNVSFSEKPTSLSSLKEFDNNSASLKRKNKVHIMINSKTNNDIISFRKKLKVINSMFNRKVDTLQNKISDILATDVQSLPGSEGNFLSKKNNLTVHLKTASTKSTRNSITHTQNSLSNPTQALEFKNNPTHRSHFSIQKLEFKSHNNSSKLNSLKHNNKIKMISTRLFNHRGVFSFNGNSNASLNNRMSTEPKNLSGFQTKRKYPNARTETENVSPFAKRVFNVKYPRLNNMLPVLVNHV